jgi:hypothetical protein
LILGFSIVRLGRNVCGRRRTIAVAFAAAAITVAFAFAFASAFTVSFDVAAATRELDDGVGDTGDERERSGGRQHGRHGR